VVALLAAVFLTLTACANDTSSRDGQQTLRIAQSAPPGSFKIGDWSGGEAILSSAVYDGIVTLGVDGKVEPGVAESWTFSDDRKTLTFRIRKGEKFSDGAPVDADAVVASFEALRKGSTSAGIWADVASVKATDPATAVVNFTKPDAAFLSGLTGAPGAIGSPKALAADSSKLTPVGSGPYTLDKAATVNGSKYVLKRNPDYWNAKAYKFDRVEVSIIADATASQNALRAGQIDVLPSAGTQDVVKTFPADRFDSGENNPTAVGVIWLADRKGTVVPALADERVRKAINLAFDRESIVKKLLGPGTAATNQILNPANPGFSKDLLGATPFDVARARALMAEAGYGSGFSVTMPSTVVSTQYESTITQSLSAIGIRVKWEQVPFQDFFTKVASRKYGMYFMFNGFTAFDAQDVRASLSGAFNPFQSTTPELQALQATANSASDAESVAAWRAVNKYFVDRAWFAPLNYSTGFWAASKNVKYTIPTSYGTNLLPFAPAAD
jgi:peptide/nickel transport system substrate-binding protein